ncbi:MAG: FixH family protein [Polyangiaceae bacterium]|nr:FixH family protein [Polyangiaceae bacterium]
MHQRRVPKTSGAFWAWLPALLLGSMLMGLGLMAYIAIDDPSFALEPDYYDKAVHWDRIQGRLRASEALGFALTVHEPITVTADGRAAIELQLTDRSGAGISGAVLEMAAFPNAFANRVEEVVFTEVAPGIYRGELRHGVAGLWELRCKVSVGTSRYTRSLRTDVVKGSAA